MSFDEELLVGEMERFRSFMNTSAKGDEWHFKLYSVPFANSKIDRKYFRYQNFGSDSPQESLALFKAALELHGDRADQFFIIRNMKGPTDPHPTDFAIKNPYYNQSIFKQPFSSSSSINGMGQIQANGSMIGMMQMMMMQQQQHFEVMQAKEKELRDEREDRKIERLEDAIDAIKEEKATAIDKIGGFFNSETGQQIINGIMGMVQNSQIAQLGAIKNSGVDNMHLAGEKPPPFKRSENETNPPSDSGNGTQAQDESAQVQNYVSQAINKLGGVFGNETLAVLFEFSEYCEKNPIVAKQLREQIRPKEQGNEQ
jgi:hypothetical protein